MKRLRLKPREDRRLRAGHRWIYSNEVDTRTVSLKTFAPGETVVVEAAAGRPLGVAHVNPHTLLCARVLDSDPAAVIDADWFERRLAAARRLREAAVEGLYYRWVFAESDDLPGLVIDRYGDVVVIQVTSAGMEQCRELIATAVRAQASPRAIVWRDDAPARETEGLGGKVQVDGSLDDGVYVEDLGLRLSIDVTGGQKTGWFYDQRDNRSRLGPWVRNARVLDVYSYTGAWSLTALHRGAREALAVDRSQSALDLAAANAERNDMKLETACGDAREVLARLQTDGRRFDVAVVDPPALVKRKRDLDKGLAHYVRANAEAMACLDDEAWLVTCSCSHHVSADMFRGAIAQAAQRAGRRLRIVGSGAQSSDHPIHPAMPESAYLKALYCHVTRA